MNQPVLMNSHVNERSEVSDIGDDALEDPVDLKVLELLATRPMGAKPERNPRPKGWLWAAPRSSIRRRSPRPTHAGSTEVDQEDGLAITNRVVRSRSLLFQRRVRQDAEGQRRRDEEHRVPVLPCVTEPKHSGSQTAGDGQPRHNRSLGEPSRLAHVALLQIVIMVGPALTEA
jgi:hypothetical protein